MSELHPALRTYLSNVKKLAGQYRPSLFWEQQLSRFYASEAHTRLEHLQPADLELIVRQGSYGFTDLPAGINDLRVDPEYRRTRKRVSSLPKRMSKISAASLGISKEDWEHMCALYFLARKGWIGEYEAFLSPLRVRSSMSVARHFYYKVKIKQIVDQHLDRRLLNVLEIGAGAGNLAYFLHTSGLVKNYCIIDLPEMLIHSGYTIQKYVEGVRMDFSPPVPSIKTGTSSHFWFVTPQELDAVSSASFDLCLNFNSFMEMDLETRDWYIDQIYRLARPGAMFINVNRRQRKLPQRDGSFFDNNPLLYPYRSTDRILHWEDDEFQQATRSNLGEAPSLAIFRAAIINEC